MKKLFSKIALPLLLCVAMFTQPVFAAPTDTTTDSQVTDNAQNVISGFETVLENDNYTLAFKSTDGNIAVTDKTTGIVRYANPLNAAEDELAVGGKGDSLKSQVMVQYYENDAVVTKNSYADSIKNNGMTFSVENDTLYVNYILGDKSFDSNRIPKILTRERMEKDILPKLTKEEQEEMLKNFDLYAKSELNPKAYELLVITYPALAEYDLYIRGKISAYKAESFYDLFIKAGYTDEDLQKDCDTVGIENAYVPKASFDVTLEYKLTDDGFNVTVDPAKIKYLEDYKPLRVCILPYFCAADNNDSGYIFVPDGSGSLINLNNGKNTVTPYEKSLFETDNSNTIEEVISPVREAVLPVFALSGSQSGFYATFDSGYEEGGVSASVSGYTSYYNNVYPYFDLVSHAYVSYGSGQVGGTVLKITDEFISCKLSVSYHFIDGGTTYAQVAIKYREYLQKNGMLPTKSKTDKTDLNVKLIGSAYVQKRFLGIPYTTISSMTTYKQAEKILSELEGLATEVNYVNALPGGSLQKNLTKFKPLSVLGSKKARKSLAESTERLTFSYFAQHAVKINDNHAAKKFDRSSARKYQYDIVGKNQLTSGSLMILSSSKLKSYAQKALKSFNKYDIESVNIQDLGYLLSSDFTYGSQIDRKKAREQVQEYLSALSKDKNVSVNYGSVYSFKFADKITEIPITHTGYKIEDTAVPFYQIVISGIIPYSTESVNLADEGITHFLKTVETGAQLQYSWYYEKPENLKYNNENYYGMEYTSTISVAKAYAKKYQPLYEKIAGKAIVDHTYVSDTLSKTVYENGITVYVNYSDAQLSVDGATVEALDYTVIGG